MRGSGPGDERVGVELALGCGVAVEVFVAVGGTVVGTVVLPAVTWLVGVASTGSAGVEVHEAKVATSTRNVTRSDAGRKAVRADSVWDEMTGTGLSIN